MQIARESRRKVLIRASMRAGGPRTDICIRDISPRGLMAQAAAPPPRGTYVDLDCAGHQIIGLVIWRRERRFGIQTRERINVAALASRIAPEILAPRRAGSRPPQTGAIQTRAGNSRALAGRMEFTSGAGCFESSPKCRAAKIRWCSRCRSIARAGETELANS